MSYKNLEHVFNKIDKAIMSLEAIQGNKYRDSIFEDLGKALTKIADAIREEEEKE